MNFDLRPVGFGLGLGLGLAIAPVNGSVLFWGIIENVTVSKTKGRIVLKLDDILLKYIGIILKPRFYAFFHPTIFNVYLIPNKFIDSVTLRLHGLYKIRSITSSSYNKLLILLHFAKCKYDFN